MIYVFTPTIRSWWSQWVVVVIEGAMVKKLFVWLQRATQCGKRRHGQSESRHNSHLRFFFFLLVCVASRTCETSHTRWSSGLFCWVWPLDWIKVNLERCSCQFYLGVECDATSNHTVCWTVCVTMILFGIYLISFTRKRSIPSTALCLERKDLEKIVDFVGFPLLIMGRGNDLFCL